MNCREPFAQGDSLLHQLDPRCKVVSAACFSFSVAALRDHRVLLLSFTFAALLLAAARLDTRRLLSRLAAANAFLAFLWLFLPWSVPGRTAAELGPLVLTDAGLAAAVTITLKCNAILMAVIAFLGTTRLLHLAHGLQSLRFPNKLLMTFIFCFRYLDVLHAEYSRLRSAIRIRGFKPHTDLHTYRTYAYLVGILFVRSHDRADRIYQAMSCRGFNGVFPAFVTLDARAKDWRMGITVVLVSVLFGLLQWAATRS